MRSLILIVAMLLGANATAQPPQPPTVYESYYTYSVATTINTGIVSPDSGPESDSCENCGGDGVLGDGITEVVCGECDGTGKKKVRARRIRSNVTAGWPPRVGTRIANSIGFQPTTKEEALRLNPDLVWVTYFHSDNCIWCVRWEGEHEGPLRRKFGFSKLKGTPHGSNPSFVLEWRGRKSAPLIGYHSLSQIEDAAKRLKNEVTSATYPDVPIRRSP